MTTFLWCLLWLSIVVITFLSIVVVTHKNHNKAKNVSTTPNTTLSPPTPPNNNHATTRNNDEIFSFVLKTIGVVVAIVLLAFLCLGLLGFYRWLNPSPPPRIVLQLPDCHTPCEKNILQITDLYTDGEPIFAQPPGWDKKDAIFYSGKGNLIIHAGNINPGKWSFWSANNPKRNVLIRVFGR